MLDIIFYDSLPQIVQGRLRKRYARENVHFPAKHLPRVAAHVTALRLDEKWVAKLVVFLMLRTAVLGPRMLAVLFTAVSVIAVGVALVVVVMLVGVGVSVDLSNGQEDERQKNEGGIHSRRAHDTWKH